MRRRTRPSARPRPRRSSSPTSGSSPRRTAGQFSSFSDVPRRQEPVRLDALAGGRGRPSAQDHDQRPGALSCSTRKDRRQALRRDEPAAPLPLRIEKAGSEGGSIDFPTTAPTSPSRHRRARSTCHSSASNGAVVPLDYQVVDVFTDRRVRRQPARRRARRRRPVRPSSCRRSRASSTSPRPPSRSRPTDGRRRLPAADLHARVRAALRRAPVRRAPRGCSTRSGGSARPGRAAVRRRAAARSRSTADEVTLDRR